MPRAWHVAFGRAGCPHQRVQRLVFDRHVMGLLDPRTQRLLGGNARGLPTGGLNAGEHLGREGRRCTSRNGDIAERRQRACSDAGAPLRAGGAADPQPRRHLLPRLGVPVNEQLEHLHAGVLATIMRALAALFQFSGTRCDWRNSSAPSVLPCGGTKANLRITEECTMLYPNSYNIQYSVALSNTVLQMVIPRLRGHHVYAALVIEASRRSYSAGLTYPSAECRRCRLYHTSRYSNIAAFASARVCQSAGWINSHSKVAKKLSATALS